MSEEKFDARFFEPTDADRALLDSRRVAVVGYGSQGHAHALNLRDSGVSVVVGLYEGSPSADAAREQGLEVMTVAEAAQWADTVALLLPDTKQPAVYDVEVEPHLAEGDVLLFAHGFNIHYGEIRPPEHVDTVLVAPKSPGDMVRDEYRAGRGVPALIGVHHDASGKALDLALAYADGLGALKAGLIETTFQEETESDLFGEQAVLCGGTSALIKAAFTTLVEAGYQPEVAYFECLHELKLIVDLIQQGGLAYMRYSVSDTAEYGDLTRGPVVVDDHVRATMKKILADVQSGAFAREWVEENKNGRPNMNRLRKQEAEHPIEQVGKKLREMMSYLGKSAAVSR